MIQDATKIKAVIFDWGGVCCREGEPFASFDLQYALQMNPNQLAEKAREIYDGYYIGKYTSDSFWRTIMTHFGLMENEKINPLVLSGSYLASYEVYPEVFAIISKLRSKYKIGLLSNLTPEMRDHIRPKHETVKYFDVEVYSCDDDVKSKKPMALPYQIVLEKMKVAAKNALFIDNSFKNIEVAENLGLQTIFFKDLPQFMEEIKTIL
ncbi:MAG: Haloacid dehalogenase superfamily, subfamily IA, variant 3 with third motif having DD or ED [Candidatus Magasanikbacteria bacterium GW2011_GWC2_45_8]|uniref:Haloacid dehalogenase superfamily, subfamily IA, variant 3 with third motif having DD or ED n=1 Tax=Candidatus Magasanikbacteria bacterium GW2011_GWC2_45_8 TaxID=1619050 RepID=A0A0G1Q800_9BACT|nr:MAG: Haloacid dehalogenase superfamily, subfamily IA, variant 3 with third motif having DD or ED [Candidatus Magasanikbacteria bacterium GW2011_GWC2_45_8]